MGMFFHLKANIIQLKQKFTVRAFFTLLVGLLLLAGNCYLFFVSAMRAFLDGVFPQIIFFVFGTIGFIASCFAIVVISLAFAVAPQNAKGANGKSVTDDFRSKSKVERIVFILLVFLFAFGGGFGALGYYISQEVKYSTYAETTATVVSYVSHGDDTYCVYRFEVDGTVYEVQGGVASGSSSVPKIGDTATIKYNPENPMDFRIGTEGRFFLAFGSIALYIGLVVVLYFIQSRGYLKLQFFLAFVMIGITVIAVLASLVTYEPHGVIQYLADNFIIHFALLFANVGVIELMNGIIYLGYKDGLQKHEKYIGYRDKEKK